MALINCFECAREISDKAAACPGCGAPVSIAEPKEPQQKCEPATSVRYNVESDDFVGSMVMMVKLAMRAVQGLGWKLDQVNESLGLVTFQTGMSWGSWSGVSCSLNIEEVTPGIFRVSGAGKQNLRGGQIIALNIGGEAQGKARTAIDYMKQLAVQNSAPCNGHGLEKHIGLIKQGRATFQDYTKIINALGGSVEAKGFIIDTHYLITYKERQSRVERFDDLRPWYLDNIVPLLTGSVST